jgi:hypothetical protein
MPIDEYGQEDSNNAHNADPLHFGPLSWLALTIATISESGTHEAFQHELVQSPTVTK